jgi:hypothetical protein
MMLELQRNFKISRFRDKYENAANFLNATRSRKKLYGSGLKDNGRDGGQQRVMLCFVQL